MTIVIIMHLQEREVESFGKILKTGRLISCTVCMESWPIFGQPSEICPLCLKSKKRREQLSCSNLMHPGAPPAYLPTLSSLEESLIALHCPVLKVIRLKGGNFGYSGNVVAVTQDLQDFVTKLPRQLIDVNYSIVMPVFDENVAVPKCLQVSSLKLNTWLRFLITSNSLYANIILDQHALENLPENGTTFGFLRPLVSLSSDDDTDPHVEVADDMVVQGIMGEDRSTSEEVHLENLIWPERSAKAIQEFKHPNIFAKCFPTIFPFGLGDPTSPTRPFAVTLAEGLTHLQKYAYYSDSAARLVWPFGEHPIAPFYAFDVKTRQSLLGQSGVFLKQAGDFPQTVEDLREKLMDPASKNQLLKQIGRYAGNLPGTPGFWQSRKDELLSLCEQSPPHIWFTLSAADLFWWDLATILPSGCKPSQFPHLVDAYVSMRMDMYVKKIWGCRAEWSWYRLEYQSRGTVHLHGCVRLRNIPDLHVLYCTALKGKSNPQSEDLVNAGIAAEKQLCDIADSLCTCLNPSPPQDAQCEERDDRVICDPHPCSLCFDDPILEKERLESTLNEVQRHRHVESYCIRKGDCRFGYGLPLSDITHFIWTPTPTGLKGTLVYKRNDRWMNNYNCGFRVWNANMDVKVIYNLYCLAEYLCGYATKSEVTCAAVARTLSLAVASSHLMTMPNPLKSAIRSAFIKGHSGRNISSQETAHLNLSLPLVCQPMLEYIRISLDSTFHQLDLENRTEITVPTLFELYRARLNSSIWIESLQEWCASVDCSQMSLQNFAINFYYCKQIARIKARGVQQCQRIIIALPRLRAQRSSKLYSKYCLHKLLLHHPWNEDHGWSESTSVPLWESFKTGNTSGQFDDAINAIDPEENDRVLFSQDINQAGFDQWDHLMSTREMALNFPHTAWTQNFVYADNCVNAINDAKTAAAEHIQPNFDTHVVLDEHQQHIVDEFCGNSSGLCIMIGSGGYGKSEVSLAIKKRLGNRIALTAMTGKAGSLINGTTLHSFAHLPIEKRNKCALSPAVLKPFQKSLEGVTHLIIDEMTMMSQETLYFLDVRLREGKASSMPFGGMNILLVGDTAQLPPVQGLCLWARPPKSSAIEITGAALYMLFNTVYTLKINYRQRSTAGAQLAVFLEGMRNGVLTSTDYEFLLSRSRERVGEIAWAAAAATAIHLYPTNDQVNDEK